jgi:hypothetical protein
MLAYGFDRLYLLIEFKVTVAFPEDASVYERWVHFSVSYMTTFISNSRYRPPGCHLSYIIRNLGRDFIVSKT